MIRLSQYNHPFNNASDITSNINASFVKPINAECVAIRRDSNADLGVVEDSDSININFIDECLSLQNKTFEKNKHYFFHGKIKRLDSTQTFYIKLVQIQPRQDEDGTIQTQYLKKIVVQPGTGWVDVEFLFTPINEIFNGLLFELQRNVLDLSVTIDNGVKKSLVRYPIIIYEELSEIQNYLTTLGHETLLKIGVQSHPSLLMCINGEEIRTGRSGIYELRNGVIDVDFFSVVSAAEEDESRRSTTLRINNHTIDYTDVDDGGNPVALDFMGGLKKLLQTNYDDMSADDREDSSKAISISIVNHPKKRLIDAFTLDYMFND